ncbi:hypothetical protein Tco_1184309 [Tanacetum coccineum]
MAYLNNECPPLVHWSLDYSAGHIGIHLLSPDGKSRRLSSKAGKDLRSTYWREGGKPTMGSRTGVVIGSRSLRRFGKRVQRSVPDPEVEDGLELELEQKLGSSSLRAMLGTISLSSAATSDIEIDPKPHFKTIHEPLLKIWCLIAKDSFCFRKMGEGTDDEFGDKIVHSLMERGGLFTCHILGVPSIENGKKSISLIVVIGNWGLPSLWMVDLVG